MIPNEYPGVALRVKAVVTDSVVLLISMISISFVFSQLKAVDDNLRMVAFLFIFVLYDPLFTSLFGGTIGHKLNGIQVKRGTDYDRNINFPLAFFRFLFKAFLGWISLLVVSGNQERKAIHDFAAGSVVLYERKSLKETGKPIV